MKQKIFAIVSILGLGLVSVLALVSVTQAATTAVPPNISVIKSFNIGMPPTLNDSQEFITGQKLELQISVTNNEASNINLIVYDAMTPTNPAACRPVFDRMRVQTAGAPTIGIGTAELGDANAYAGAMALELPPGESWVARIVMPVRSAEPGCEIAGAPTVYAAIAEPMPGSCQAGRSPQCRYEGWTPSSEDVLNLVQTLEPVAGNLATATYVTPDLGDAPDSSNHFGVPMSAYPTIQANFPTVYDPATGAPSGPRHLHARPLRLGQLASRERDADLNPNRNLNPNANLANLDTRDDGLALNSVSFDDCAVSTLTARITVEQWAIDYLAETDSPAYLNVWVDGNRDGDWADAKNCADSDPAAEHIIINSPVDLAALGVGTHTITVNTGNVPWPTARENAPSWLRISISDDKAPTPLTFSGLSYGDGRGPVGGYTLGETEDYRRRSPNTPPGQLDGADLAVQVDGQIELRDIPPIEIKLASDQMLTHTNAIFRQTVTLFNRGDTLATGTKLVIMPDPALRNHNVTFDIATDPPLPPDIMRTTCHGSDADCKIEIDLSQPATLQALGTESGLLDNEPLSVAVSGQVLCDPMTGGICSATTLTARAQVTSDNDNNPANDSAEKQWDLPAAVDSMLPPSITSPSSGTTNNNQVTLQGLARPMATVNIFTDGFESGDVSAVADGSGRWQATLNLEAGPHQIIATYPSNALRSHPLNIIVKPNLRFDPLGMLLTYDGHTYQPWGRNGRVDEQGWAIQMISDRMLRMDIPFTCEADNASVTLIQNGSTLANFTDTDKDGIFTAEFKGTDEELAALRFVCANQQRTYTGETVQRPTPLQVVDANSNEPLPDVAMIMFETFIATDDLWTMRRDPSINGQPNPRFTNANGEAFFAVPNGTYNLTAQIDGYQAFQSPPISASRCLTCIDRAIRLTPLETAANQMALTSDGFNPPQLTISAGESIGWANVDVANRGIEASTSGAKRLSGSQNAPLWLSGALRAGDRFSATFDEPGTYTLIDPLDPQMRATVIVEPAGPSEVFLPAVIRP